MFLIFSGSKFFDIFNRHFRNFATWRDSGFNIIFVIELPLKCPIKMRRQNSQILPISGPNRNKFSAAVPQRGKNRKSKTIMSTADYFCTRWHNFGVGRLTNNGDRRASLHVGWEDIATFGKYGVISRKRHKIDIQLLWMTYTWWAKKPYCFWKFETPVYVDRTAFYISNCSVFYPQ